MAIVDPLDEINVPEKNLTKTRAANIFMGTLRWIEERGAELMMTKPNPVFEAKT